MPVVVPSHRYRELLSANNIHQKVALTHQKNTDQQNNYFKLFDLVWFIFLGKG